MPSNDKRQAWSNETKRNETRRGVYGKYGEFISFFSFSFDFCFFVRLLIQVPLSCSERRRSILLLLLILVRGEIYPSSSILPPTNPPPPSDDADLDVAPAVSVSVVAVVVDVVVVSPNIIPASPPGGVMRPNPNAPKPLAFPLLPSFSLVTISM